MSDADLGQFSDGFATWRHILSTVPADDRPKIFGNAADEVAGYVAKGLDRVVAADQLADMAMVYGLYDTDAVQATIAVAFKKIDSDSNIKLNGSHEPRLSLKAFEDIAMTTVPSYLVKGIIPRTGLAIVWGPPKCGKSFWAFDLVMHVALGWKYRGRRVQQATVVYLALEGGHGFRNRVEAWRRRRHLAEHRGEVPFYLLDVPVDLVADRDKLIEAMRAQLGRPAARRRRHRHAEPRADRRREQVRRHGKVYPRSRLDPRRVRLRRHYHPPLRRRRHPTARPHVS